MSKPVLFVSGLGNSLKRSENLGVIYDAYPGPKKFMHVHNLLYEREVHSGKYDLMVIDVFPEVSPGKCIMIWHAIQGGKHIGLDEKATYYKPSYAALIDRIVCAGHGAVDMFHQCTLVPKERILNLGMPRTDRYIGKRKGDGGTILSKYKSYLYVPTFRTRKETPLPQIDWEWLDNNLYDNERFVVKAHPFTNQLNVPNLRHIMEISGMEPSVNYLYDCDVLITDYSSIMFDGYLLGKPCVIFEKNPGYTDVRGMYLQYPNQYSSRYATNEHELLSLIRSAEGLTKTEHSCLQTVADMCDGHSCERILQLINEMNGGKTT